jgi:thioredoxin 1
MSDADDELESIRERKLDDLRRRAEAGGTENGGTENGGTAAGGREPEGGAADGSPREPVHVRSREHLGELVEAGGVVLVDFHADWCGPCRMLEPTVEALARETPATVAKVDVDVQSALATEYEVRGIPLLLLFADGEPVERVTGVRDRETLEGLVRQYTG